MNKLKIGGRSNTDLINPIVKMTESSYNPYIPNGDYCKNDGNTSRDSSISKSTNQMKKPPTVPKPFRLSTSNSRKKENEDTTPQGSQDRTPKASINFRATKLPKSHRMPFMVLHSTKNLTHPESFNLKTDERSQSRHRSDSNQHIGYSSIADQPKKAKYT